MVTKMNYVLFSSITQGHLDYNDNSQRNFGNTCLWIFTTFVLCCSTILPPTQEFRFEKKKQKTSSNRWCARGCWFAPITNRGKEGGGEENCWHLFMGNSFMVQSRAKAFVLKKLCLEGWMATPKFQKSSGVSEEEVIIMQSVHFVIRIQWEGVREVLLNLWSEFY